MANTQYDDFIRNRITELRISKNISEHKMSLDLDKSGSYIRGITSGAALPSLKELFNIIAYFNMTPAEFFAPMDDAETHYLIRDNPALSRPSMVLLEQIRTIDKQRIERYLGRVTRKEMFGINRALLVSLDLNTSSRQ